MFARIFFFSEKLLNVNCNALLLVITSMDLLSQSFLFSFLENRLLDLDQPNLPFYEEDKGIRMNFLSFTHKLSVHFQ